MQLSLSKHAKDRLSDWMTPVELVHKIILTLDKVETDIHDSTIYSKLVIEKNKKYLYRVFVNQTKNPPVLVTVYKTSKFKKYGY